MDNYIGRVLGNRYVLREVIGIGGMAVVYKAYDNVDNKTVAVKILKEEYIANDEFRKRFRNESKAVAMLSHSNIVKVYDVSFGEKLQYIVMEYIDGVTLKQYIEKNSPLSWLEAVNFTSQILKALEHAHEKGIIHRDIKPQNIMLLKDNKTIKVTDFGIARFNGKETIADGALGSVHYVSPEQASGMVVDNRTDIYSAGVVLYEMLTGQLPFQSDSAVSVALMQLQKDAPLPRSINPSIPIGIEQITMHAMQKSPNRRYRSASEMLMDIEEFKRNPNTRFNYYDINSTENDYRPTGKRYASGSPVGSDNNTGYAGATVITKEPDEFDYEDEELAKKNYTLPILITLIFVFIVIIIGVAWYFFTNTDEVTVPDFVGKHIEDIRDDDEYKYFFDHGLIEENLVYTTEYDEGYIFYQSEEKGKKLQISSTTSSIIKLNIAYTSESMQIPEIDKNTKLQEARSILQKLGFNIETEGVVDTSVPISTVLRLDPPSGKSVAYGSTVTIYYAIDDEGKVAVPDVVGEKLSVAKAELEELGIAVNVKYEDAPANKAGIVIEQSIEADSTVIAADTEITIVVGASTTKTAYVSITLPNLSNAVNEDDAYESIYVYVGGSLYKTYSSVYLNGSSQSVELGGSGRTDFKIYIGSQTVCTGSVDFSGGSPSITSKQTSSYSYSGETKPAETTAPPTTEPPTTEAPTTAAQLVSIPSYSGKLYSDYFNDLLYLGFENARAVDMASSTVPEGYVISVSAEKSSYTPEEAKTAEITVYVSSGSNDE